MQSFVANRAGSPARPQSANSKRQAAAANAKQAVPRTSLQPEPAQQHTTAQIQRVNNPNRNGLVNRGQRRDSGETISGRNDLYGTDAGSSIDTTIHSQPANKAEQVRRVQDSQHGQAARHKERVVYDSESEHHSSDDEEDDGEEEEYEQGYQNDEMDYDARSGSQQDLPQHGLFMEGNSYPSTTSGLPDDRSYHEIIEQQRPFQPAQNHNQREPVQQHPVQSYPMHPTQPPIIQRTNGQPAVTSNMAVPSTFEKGTIIRETEQRVQKDLNRRGRVAHQPNASLDVPHHPVGSNMAIPQRPGGPTANHRALTPGSQIPQPAVGVTQTLAPKSVRASPGPSILAARPAQTQAQIQFQEELTARHHPVEEDLPPEAESPVEDYDAPVLFELEYEQLKNEDFDHEPRGTNKVISDDMQQRKLSERLVHVQKNLTVEDQGQFFRALKTDEWEEAGDWFLEQFTNIISRAKDARQNKRKLAREFEDQVEQRYRHVAKRQQNVETALQGMKAKGQGLIPKSPRASREPSVKASRLQKR